MILSLSPTPVCLQFAFNTDVNDRFPQHKHQYHTINCPLFAEFQLDAFCRVRFDVWEPAHEQVAFVTFKWKSQSLKVCF